MVLMSKSDTHAADATRAVREGPIESRARWGQLVEMALPAIAAASQFSRRLHLSSEVH
jgi:hypothetical protein